MALNGEVGARPCVLRFAWGVSPRAKFENLSVHVRRTNSAPSRSACRAESARACRVEPKWLKGNRWPSPEIRNPCRKRLHSLLQRFLQSQLFRAGGLSVILVAESRDPESPSERSHYLLQLVLQWQLFRARQAVNRSGCLRPEAHGCAGGVEVISNSGHSTDLLVVADRFLVKNHYGPPRFRTAGPFLQRVLADFVRK